MVGGRGGWLTCGCCAAREGRRGSLRHRLRGRQGARPSRLKRGPGTGRRSGQDEKAKRARSGWGGVSARYDVSGARLGRWWGGGGGRSASPSSCGLSEVFPAPGARRSALSAGPSATRTQHATSALVICRALPLAAMYWKTPLQIRQTRLGVPDSASLASSRRAPLAPLPVSQARTSLLSHDQPAITITTPCGVIQATDTVMPSMNYCRCFGHSLRFLG